MLNFDDIELNIKKDKSKIKVEKIRSKDIAIIGVSIKMPMADDCRSFWKNLKLGKDCIGLIPDDRRKDIEDYLSYIENKKKLNFCEMGYLDDIDKFDYKFFGLSPNEANLMDPNQRVFLQEAWHALEDAGYGGGKLIGSRTGVYLGYSSVGDSSYLNIISDVDYDNRTIGFTGNISAVIASRISYILNLRGPSLLIDTTCSSSLIAIHSACQAIRNGECDYAIAGGTKICVLPVESSQKIGIESSNNRTMAFDDNSDGAGSGEGVVVLLLKSLDKAIKDKDNIYAVIKGSSMNQDGRSIGLTAPNPAAQEDVIVRAWKDADINPEEISYIETHGTGTNLGDPIEIDGITRAFSKFTDKKQFCAISALKSNIGHLDSCSGAAGIVKAIMSLKNKELAPIVHLKVPNTKIDFEKSPVYLVDEAKKWESEGKLRKCGVSSFGLSGCNCHMILEEFVNDESVENDSKGNFDILTISAKEKESLEDMLYNYIKMLEDKDCPDVKDIAYTANTGRGHYEYRLAVIFSDKDDLINKLKKVYNNTLELSDKEIYESLNNSIPLDDKNNDLTDITQDKVKNILNSDRNEIGLFKEICEFYIKGIKVDWELFYRNQNRRRVSVPVYSFMNTRCWVKIPHRDNAAVISGIEEELESAADKSKIDYNFSTIKKVVTNAWSKYLGFDNIDENANYYSLGGDSLIAIQIINKLNTELEMHLSLKQLLDNLTISKLSNKIIDILNKTSEDERQLDVIKIAEKRECYPLSAPQERMFISHTLEGTGRSYNIFGAFEIRGKLNINRLEDSINKVIERQESLRTSFELVDGTPMQIIHDELKIKLFVKDILEENINNEIDNLITTFELNRIPLIKFSVLRISDEKFIFLYNMDHIISDGVSMGIFIDELCKIYNGESLEKMNLQYKDYAVWQSNKLKSEEVYRQGEYWKERFKGELPVLDLLPDFSITDNVSNEGDYVRVRTSEHLKDKLNILAVKSNTTLYNVLLSAYYVLLMKYTNQEDIIIGTPIAGRENEKVEKIVGMFVNTLAMRNYPCEDKTFLGFLEEVKVNTLKAIENQDFQLEMLINELNVSRDKNKGTLFETTFVFQNMKIEELKLNQIEAEYIECNIKFSPYKIALVSVEEKEGINMIFEYQTSVFKKETVENFAESYLEILDQIAEDKNKEISEINIISNQNNAELDLIENEDLDFDFD